MSDSAGEHDQPGERGAFATTHWSIVLAAGQDHDPGVANAALATLCRTYWYPLFAYARRHGHDTPDAQDLVQGFFAQLLERRDLRSVRQERGRFRSYLLVAFKHFMASEWRQANAARRGGGHLPISLDDLMSGQGPWQLPAEELSPDRYYDRQWALALLRRVLAALRDEQCRDGRERQFDRLREFLTDSPLARSQAEIAAELGTSEGAVKQAVFRLRQRYQTLLRTEVAQTVVSPGDVESELRHLIAAMRD